MKPILTKRLAYLLCTSVLMFSSGCGIINDDLEPCTETYHISFVYDYNLLWADAFAHEVKAVDVWAYDSAGNLVWNGSASGDDLAVHGFSLNAELAPGEYTFLCWAGLVDGSHYRLTSSGATLSSLGTELTTSNEDGANVSDKYLPPLYHGLTQPVTLHPANGSNVEETVTVSLMRDTKSISLMLQNSDGNVLDPNDFSASISTRNLLLAYDNAFIDSPEVEYRPWRENYGSVDSSRADSDISAVIYNFNTNRLNADSETRLRVVRLSDNTEIINIPMVDYFLLVKDNYGNLSDQEYLDRQSDYSMILFLDNNSNWNITAGIYINNWAVVPPQVVD